MQGLHGLPGPIEGADALPRPGRGIGPGVEQEPDELQIAQRRRVEGGRAVRVAGVHDGVN